MEPLNHALVLLSKLSSGAAGGNTGAEGLRLFGLRPKEDIGLKLLVGFIKFDTLFFLAAGDVDFSKLSLSGEEPLPWVGYAEDRLRTCCGEDGCEACDMADRLADGHTTNISEPRHTTRHGQ